MTTTSVTLPGTLLPRAFVSSASAASVAEEAAGIALPLPYGYTRALPSCRCLPEHACSFEETDMSSRPEVLPPGFELLPTPPDSMVSNFSSQSYPARTCNSSWKSNLFVLKMGHQYAPIVGRGMRLAHRPCTLVLEITYSSFSIFFDQAVLSDGTGVEYYPAFIPRHEDVNHYAKQDTDYTRLQNVVPAAPPGGFLAFGRLSGKMAVKPDRRLGLLSSNKEHPVVRGDRLFSTTVLNQSRTKLSGAMQEGGIGFLVFRPKYETFGIQRERVRAGKVTTPAGGQLIQMYFRCAFGPEALDEVDIQRGIVDAAIEFALGNSQKDEQGVPFLSVVHTMKPALIPAGACPRAFEEERTVNVADVGVVTAWLLASHLCCENRFLSWEGARQEAALQISLAGYIEERLAAGLSAVDECDILVEIDDDDDNNGEDNDGGVGGHDLAGSATRTGTGMGMGMTMATATATTTTTRTACTVMHTSRQRVYAPDEAQYAYDTYCACREKAKHRAQHSHCSPVLFYTAPPDAAKFGERPVVVCGVLLAVRLGITLTGHLTAFQRRLARRTAGDLGTRFMCDVMLFNPVIAVTPCETECMLSLFTDKAPGLLNVRSACRGVPIQATSTSDHRRIKNAHPSINGVEIYTTDSPPLRLAEGGVPAFSRAQADRNPFLKALIRGGKTPYVVAGIEVSIYDAGHTCQTGLAGTRHSWAVKGAILYHRIMKPRTKDYPFGFFDDSVTAVEREEAIQFLFPPDYNSTACQIYSETGAWSVPGTTHRPWKKPYGVDVSVMHRAMWWWYTYPAFIGDKTHPGTLDIWTLKARAEAEIHWMGRWGRIIRQLLNKRRRKVRSDYAQAVFRNYYCKLNRVPGAPIADLALSAINVFRDTLILGERQACDDGDDGDDGDDDENKEGDGDGDCDENEDGGGGGDQENEDADDYDEDGGDVNEDVSDPLAMLYGHGAVEDIIEITTSGKLHLTSPDVDVSLEAVAPRPVKRCKHDTEA